MQGKTIRQSNSTGVKTYVWGRSSQAGIPTLEYSANTQDNSTSIVDNDANGMPIAFASGATSQYVVFDGLGRMWGTVGNTGDVTSKYEYDPYQQLTNITYPAGSPSASTKSTAEMQASASNSNGAGGSGGGTPWSTFGVQDDLVKNWWKRGARWHDTRNGVWTSVDPITRLADPTRANPYSYVGGDPINQFDPAGRFDLGDVGDFALSLAAGAAGRVTFGAVGMAAPGPLPVKAAVFGFAYRFGGGCAYSVTWGARHGSTEPGGDCVVGGLGASLLP